MQVTTLFFRILVQPLIIFMFFLSTTIQAQIPDKFENLQILPKDIEKRALMNQMRTMAISLGVRCSHCHVGEPNAPLSTYDFASDKKLAKETARTMMRMTQTINKDVLGKLKRDESKAVAVNCLTCHRGLSKPKMIEDELNMVLKEQGLPATLDHYRTLRKQFYGGFSYDFQANGLLTYANELMQAGKQEAALAMVNLNLEFHPKLAMNQYALSEYYKRTGDAEKAIQYMEKAVELEPQNPFFKGRLKQLKDQ